MLTLNSISRLAKVRLSRALSQFQPNMPSSPPPYLPTHELHSRLPRFLPNLIHPRLLATFDARDELTATALDDAPLAVSVSRDSFAASEKRGDRSFGGSNSSDAIGALRVVVVKQDAVVEATEVSVSSAEASSISPDELIQSIEEYEKNDSEFGGEMAVTPKALPPPPSASRLIPLGNSGPVRALKLSPATLNSNSNSQLLTATNSSPSVPFLAILRTPKSVELFSLGAHDGDPPKFIQEISRDRRNAEGIIGIEWTAAGDLLIVGSGGVEGWRWNPKRAEFVLRRSLAIPVSW